MPRTVHSATASRRRLLQLAINPRKDVLLESDPSVRRLRYTSRPSSRMLGEPPLRSHSDRDYLEPLLVIQTRASPRRPFPLLDTLRKSIFRNVSPRTMNGLEARPNCSLDNRPASELQREPQAGGRSPG